MLACAAPGTGKTNAFRHAVDAPIHQLQFDIKTKINTNVSGHKFFIYNKGHACALDTSITF
jgi:hypothetical protein